jgi:hypothetical protein
MRAKRPVQAGKPIARFPARGTFDLSCPAHRRVSV